jgi:hypothetical protein
MSIYDRNARSLIKGTKTKNGTTLYEQKNNKSLSIVRS